jgi:NitT/TauT family transport system ATP-binding protein
MKLALEFKGVVKRFRQKRNDEPIVVFDGLDFSVTGDASGEILVLLGPSGCGKTTLLNLVSGLLTPDEGEIRVFGDLVIGPNSHSVMVPQAYTCFPWLTALGNVEFGLAVRGFSRRERRLLSVEYLTKVGLGDRLDAYPSELSGGMQQRVAIARTLVLRPTIVLMDEPFGALDSQTRTQMQQLVLALWGQEKNLILFVTHDIQEALLLADRIFLLPPRPVKRIVTEVHVPFGRPRSETLLFEPSFAVLARQLRTMLDPSNPSRVDEPFRKETFFKEDANRN